VKREAPGPDNPKTTSKATAETGERLPHYPVKCGKSMGPTLAMRRLRSTKSARPGGAITADTEGENELVKQVVERGEHRVPVGDPGKNASW